MPIRTTFAQNFSKYRKVFIKTIPPRILFAKSILGGIVFIKTFLYLEKFCAKVVRIGILFIKSILKRETFCKKSPKELKYIFHLIRRLPCIVLCDVVVDVGSCGKA